MARKSVKQGSNRGRIVGVVSAGAGRGWLFIVQAFTTTDNETPVVCGFARADQLSGNTRKKAERWAAWLDMKGEAA